MWKFATLLLAFALFAHSEQGKVKIPPGNFNVEIYFVADNKCLEKYLAEENNNANKAKESLRNDINYFLTEVNKMYSSLYETTMKISVRAIDILDGNAYKGSRDLSGGVIHEDNALNDFGQYLTDQGAAASYNYDIAILFTGYNLANEKDDKTLGYAHVGTVCNNPKNVGVVELDATYNTVTTTAHEIAHILGANHDAVSSSWVMAPQASIEGKDRWFFSLCSASNAWDVINGMTENCMLNTKSSSITPNSGVTDKLRDPNAVCQRKWGSGYYFSHYKGVYNDQIPAGDEVCKRIYCGKKAYNTVRATMISDGMPCGVGKTCKEGTCQTDANSAAAAAVTDDKCVFGDVKYAGSDEISCADTVKKYGVVQTCSISWFKEKCCATYPTLNCEQYLDSSCPANRPIKCKNSDTCLPGNWMCDNYNDCGDNWDEKAEFCPTKKRSLVDILLDESLDKRDLLDALVTLRDRESTITDVEQDETPKVAEEEPKSTSTTEAELLDRMA